MATPATLPRTTKATNHVIRQGDARQLNWIASESIHLIVTSPPYWTLKEYPANQGQLGLIADYEAFHDELDKVWKHCFRVLVPGGRLVSVVGDVCLSRRRHGRHLVMPMHADIVVRARRLGFDNLTPIFWYKIANANYEVENGSAGFLGKPYEPNAIIKNDVEFILMLRKPGGYRQPTDEQREASKLSKEEYQEWFQQVWSGLTGESTRHHPAPFPEELAYRLVRMFSFTGDTVLDPFMGTGTTLLAAARCGRNSVGVDVEPAYTQMAKERMERELPSLFGEGTAIRASLGPPDADPALLSIRLSATSPGPTVTCSSHCRKVSPCISCHDASVAPNDSFLRLRVEVILERSSEETSLFA